MQKIRISWDRHLPFMFVLLFLAGLGVEVSHGHLLFYGLLGAALGMISVGLTIWLGKLMGYWEE